MKKNKGFTLVELLAVIAILAILVIIALPNVMGMFNQAKESSFMTELKQIYKVAQQQWISDSLFGTGEKVYSRCDNGCTNSLDLSGRTELEYYIKIDQGGSIVEYYATDGTYQYGYSGPGLLPTDIKTVVHIADINEDDKIVIDGGGATDPNPVNNDNVNEYAIMFGNTNTKFLRTNTNKSDIEAVIITDSFEGHTANGTDCFDVSYKNNGSVLAWVTDLNNNGLKEVFIGSSQGKVYVENGANLFRGLTNVVDFADLELLNTVNTTNMSYMFADCTSLTEIYLDGLNVNKVENMSYMFSNCTSLNTISFWNTRTSSLKNVHGMFKNCTGLTSLDTSDFKTENVTDMGSMFEGCTALTVLNIYNMDTTKVTNMSAMFKGMSNITELTIDSFTTDASPDISEMFSGMTNITHIYGGNGFIGANARGTNVFTGDVNLVGGSGTRYSSAYNDKQYARVDAGSSNPGLFSRGYY